MGTITVWKTDYLDGLVDFREEGVAKVGKNFVICDEDYVEFKYDNPDPKTEKDWEWKLFELGYYSQFVEYDRKNIREGYYEREIMKFFRRLSDLRLSLLNFGKQVFSKTYWMGLEDVYYNLGGKIPVPFHDEYKYEDDREIEIYNIEVEEYSEGIYKLYIYVKVVDK